jgi:hypothetical protein
MWDFEDLVLGSIPKSLIPIVSEKWKFYRNGEEIEVISECYQYYLDLEKFESFK